VRIRAVKPRLGLEHRLKSAVDATTDERAVSADATILVLGDPGPFRLELLGIPRVELLWVSSPGEVAGALGRSGIDAVLVSSAFEQSPLMRLVLRTVASEVPVVMLRPQGSGPSEVEARPVMEVVEVPDLSGVLSRATGRYIRRPPRVEMTIPLMIEHKKRRLHGQTVELGVTGLTARDLPTLPTDVPLRLALRPDGGAPVVLRVRIASWFDLLGRRMASIEFLELGAREHAVLEKTVKTRLLAEESRKLALRRRRRPAEDVAEPASAEPPMELGSILETLAGLYSGRLSMEKLPVWLVVLAGELTPTEIEAARGGPAPPWAHESLRLRAGLLRARFGASDADLPALLDDTYRLIDTLKDEAHGEEAEVVRVLGRARAWLLRSIVFSLARRGDQKRSRREAGRRMPRVT
jgi:hypothetical protein